MKTARRLDNLGTETAFRGAQAAAEWRGAGNRVYPFHLGDLNFPMADHIVEAMNKAIRDGKTGYCPGPGIPELRAALADEIGTRRGMTIEPSEVIVTTGGKPVITKFLQAVMDPGEGVLYPNPGFPIYESQIEYLGGNALPYRYVPTSDGFAIDLDHLRA
ncbi:MAG: aminotransferase class I/II-fold pyridoxal phosphate-dependent enzyme, partial [Brevibacterium sp.]|nr:aminotransferase class I/II-fold pyridoxal phosphate-dependent enzyme [Brevibacterium sp.]